MRAAGQICFGSVPLFAYPTPFLRCSLLSSLNLGLNRPPDCAMKLTVNKCRPLNNYVGLFFASFFIPSSFIFFSFFFFRFVRGSQAVCTFMLICFTCVHFKVRRFFCLHIYGSFYHLHIFLRHSVCLSICLSNYLMIASWSSMIGVMKTESQICSLFLNQLINLSIDAFICLLILPDYLYTHLPFHLSFYLSFICVITYQCSHNYACVHKLIRRQRISHRI